MDLNATHTACFATVALSNLRVAEGDPSNTSSSILGSNGGTRRSFKAGTRMILVEDPWLVVCSTTRWNEFQARISKDSTDVDKATLFSDNSLRTRPNQQSIHIK
ncbi:unnamed protein product [Somion occarium]|uniref:Uncharacterized protein n=1 Tax=Somion occarium TaxID=3059160 RepID=A0ABP1CU38_9APHY